MDLSHTSIKFHLKQTLRNSGVGCSSSSYRTVWHIHGRRCRLNAFICKHRSLHRQRNYGRYLGNRRLCAQIGANVHLSGGVGIGGVLEPAGAKPVITGDGAFIGSRAIVVEGVEIGNEAVLAANVTITSSTPIIDIRDGKISESKGRVPERAVVVPGTKEKELEGGGKIYTSCAYIIGDRKPSTDLKTSLNDVLREFTLSV